MKQTAESLYITIHKKIGQVSHKAIFYISILILSFLSCKTDIKIESEYLDKSKIMKIDSLANRYLELNRFSGDILVTKEDMIIYNKSFGLADYENKVSFSNKTAIKIGQISELVTAVINKTPLI